MGKKGHGNIWYEILTMRNPRKKTDFYTRHDPF
jgi:hypothetical protein